MAEPVFTSLIKLIAGSDELRGQSVRVIGYSVLRFESRALYVTEADYRNAVTKNALWLQFEIQPEPAKFDECYVLVEGIFDPENRGHLQLYSGAIRDVSRIQVWRP